MEPPPNDPPPHSESASELLPVLQYHVPEKTEARWGMPRSAQIIFGVFFFFASAALVAVAIAGVGGLAMAIFACLLSLAIYIHGQWKWPGFTIGIFLAIGASILFMGICAVVVSGR